MTLPAVPSGIMRPFIFPDSSQEVTPEVEKKTLLELGVHTGKTNAFLGLHFSSCMLVHVLLHTITPCMYERRILTFCSTICRFRHPRLRLGV